MNGVTIRGVGKSVPAYHMSNDELSTKVDTSDEWIRSRTGIAGRYLSKGETTTELAIQAAKQAILNADIDPKSIDLIVLATITPDEVMPSTACRVQEAIGAVNATAFDVTAACSGFVFAAQVATQAIQVGSAKCALVIGAEVLSKVLDWEDRNTCVLFGDGAGAAIFKKHHKNNIINFYTGSDGKSGNALTLSGRAVNNCLVEADRKTSYMGMDGREVYRFATTVVPTSIQKVLENTPYEVQDIDLFILHQANARIMDSVASKLEVSKDKFFKNLQTYGNTSAASIPIALCEASTNLKPGDKLVLSGFGGGLTWGSMLIIWE